MKTWCWIIYGCQRAICLKVDIAIVATLRLDMQYKFVFTFSREFCFKLQFIHILNSFGVVLGPLNSCLFPIVNHFQNFSKIAVSLLRIFKVICRDCDNASISQNYFVVNNSAIHSGHISNNFFLFILSIRKRRILNSRDKKARQ